MEDTPELDHLACLALARTHLSLGDADAALAVLATAPASSPLELAQSAWLRALAAATQGDAVRTHVALRQATRELGLPATAVADVARSFAQAVLDDADQAPAWRVLAVVVHDEADAGIATSDLHLAWELTARAADAAPPEERSAMVLLLATVQAQLGHRQAAVPLARAVQQGALAARDSALFASATLLLADLCHDEDPELGHDVLAHGARLLGGLGDPAQVGILAQRADDLRLTWRAQRTDDTVC